MFFFGLLVGVLTTIIGGVGELTSYVIGFFAALITATIWEVAVTVWGFLQSPFQLHDMQKAKIVELQKELDEHNLRNEHLLVDIMGTMDDENNSYIVVYNIYSNYDIHDVHVRLEHAEIDKQDISPEFAHKKDYGGVHIFAGLQWWLDGKLNDTCTIKPKRAERVLFSRSVDQTGEYACIAVTSNKAEWLLEDARKISHGRYDVHITVFGKVGSSDTYLSREFVVHIHTDEESIEVGDVWHKPFEEKKLLRQ